MIGAAIRAGAAALLLLVAAQTARAVEACPYKPNVMTLHEGETVTCACANVSAMGFRVYGTDIYTADSDTCLAAVHAGVIPATGGTVSFRPVPGCGGYKGTERAGIVSLDFGPYPMSVVFGEKTPICSNVADRAAFEKRFADDCRATGHSEESCRCRIEKFHGPEEGAIAFGYDVIDALRAGGQAQQIADTVTTSFFGNFMGIPAQASFEPGMLRKLKAQYLELDSILTEKCGA